MTIASKKLEEKYPGTNISEGAQIGDFCRIDEGCEISAESVIKLKTALCKDVHIIGTVQIDPGVVIRENVTLVGPLHISQNVFIAHDTIIGATREEDSNISALTEIGEYCRIGKEVEIQGGVKIGSHARVRSGSHVIGDIPQFGLASRSPAILERFACPKCGGQFMILGGNSDIISVRCRNCNRGEMQFSSKNWSGMLNHILLPNGGLGAIVSTLGDNPLWLDEWEIR